MSQAQTAVSTEQQRTPASAADVTVFYDGACPLCRREIGFYQGLKGADTIDWVDLAHCNDDAIPDDITRQQLLGRFHIQTADQTVKSGAAAFVEIWQSLPAFRPFAKLARIPGAMPVLEFGYTVFLKFRPALQRLARKS